MAAESDLSRIISEFKTCFKKFDDIELFSHYRENILSLIKRIDHEIKDHCMKIIYNDHRIFIQFEKDFYIIFRIRYEQKVDLAWCSDYERMMHYEIRFKKLEPKMKYTFKSIIRDDKWQDMLIAQLQLFFQFK